MNALRDIESQRGVDVEQRIAIAKGKIHTPAGIQYAIPQRLIELVQKEYGVWSVVGVEEVRGTQKRSPREDAQSHNQDNVPVEPLRQSLPAIRPALPTALRHEDASILSL